MKKIVYSLVYVTLLAFGTNAANAQHWRSKHLGLPVSFGAKFVYGEGTSMMVASSGFGGTQMYYTPDTSTSWSASPSTLGMYAEMEDGVVKAYNMHFVASIGGVFKSHDFGHNWTSVSTAGAVACYAVYAYNDTLYASMGAGAGAPKFSADTGLTWTDVPGYTGPLVNSFLKYNGVLYVGSTGGLRYTADFGATWHYVTTPTPLMGQIINGITELGGNIYVGCNNGVFKSADNGVTWTSVFSASIFCLTTIDTSLLCGTDVYGVYQSDQSATHWTQFAAGLPPSGGTYQTVNYISHNDYFIIATAYGDSAIYVLGLGELGLHPTPAKIINSVKEEMQITLYPNPAKQEVTIYFGKCTDEKVTAGLYDITGRFIKSQNLINHSDNIKFDLRDVAPGDYFLHVTRGGNLAIKKLVVEK